jgi:hypothetical protein
VSRSRSIQAVLATALIGGGLLASPGSAFAAGEVVWGPGQITSGQGPNICLDNPGVVNNQSRKCLTVKGNVTTTDDPVIQYTCTTGANEEWQVDYQAADLQWMVAKNSGKCATVEAVSQANKTPIVQYPCQSDSYPYENQRWNFF